VYGNEPTIPTEKQRNVVGKEENGLYLFVLIRTGVKLLGSADEEQNVGKGLDCIKVSSHHHVDETRVVV
jgi:hypothetical protein